MKTEVGILDGTPVKRMFWSIISDYDLGTGLCELIDNALDFWIVGGRVNKLEVDITLDANRQIITVRDNAGGVDKESLRLLIAPGGSGNDPLGQVIGVFGVGSKRASVALGEAISIKTRHASGVSHQLDITKEWIETDDWDMPIYEISDFIESSTEVKITELRRTFSKDSIAKIKASLSEIYAYFIDQGCVIAVNGEALKPKKFESWSYPAEFLPTEVSFDLDLEELGKVNISIEAGLISDRSHEGENYGVYFYCNERLIVKEMRKREVGYFNSNEAGVPHPDGSLARCVVWISGAARAMPWNSSKSDINFDHQVFQEIRPTLVSQISYFSKLSRRLKSEWPEKVFKFETGSVRKVGREELGPSNKVIHPELPRTKKVRIETLKNANRHVIKSKPWVLGLVESFGAVDVLQKNRFDSKNRMSLLLLDSTFEIGLKEFIVNRPDLFPPAQYNDAKIKTLFSRRSNVTAEIESKIPKLSTYLPKVTYYYNLRNKFIHERATVGVTDHQVQDYREVVEKVLELLFGLKFPS